MEAVMPRYYEFEVTLTDIEPAIWRRFQLPADAAFQDLHEAIQDSAPWKNYHLFAFVRNTKEREVIATSDDEDRPKEDPIAEDVPLSSYFRRERQKCVYLYDFGDGWRHIVELKAVIELPERFTRRLLDGARAFPPEDCGGVWGYRRCLAALGLVDAEECDKHDLREFRSWLGRWKPEKFGLKAAKKRFDEVND
jgi:hypothetical protein